MAPPLTVIVPCYNEAARLPGFFALIDAHPELTWEWLFVDDGSRDATPAMLREFAAAHPGHVSLHTQPANCGKGAAVRAGLLAAQGELVGYVDADLAASPLQFARFLTEPDLRAGRELIVGIRVLTQDGRVKRYFYRHLMGRAFQTYASVLTGLTVYDTQCGFKLMARATARALAARMRTDGFGFDVELLLLAHRDGLHLREEMITWVEQGQSKVRPRHLLLMALEVWRISRRAYEPPPAA